MDEKEDEVEKNVREAIENSLGLNAEEQNDIEETVAGIIPKTSTIFEGMKALRDQNGMDPKSIFAGTVLGSMTAPTKTKICVAIPVDIMDVLRECIDENENGGEGEKGEKGDTKVAD